MTAEQLPLSALKTLRDIAARPKGLPEGYFGLSGVRSRNIKALLRAGLVERVKSSETEGVTMYRMKVTAEGAALAAQGMNKGDNQ